LASGRPVVRLGLSRILYLVIEMPTERA